MLPHFARRMMRAASLSSAICLAAACAGTADASRAWSTTMLAEGDTVVARTTGVIPDSGTHRLTEVWRVGDADALDSTITFGGIGGFAVAADNTVAVFDQTGPTLRLYDVNGRYVRTLGRKGAGPGEYSAANGMAFLPDGRLALWDPPTSRITLYAPDGTVTAAWTPPVTGWWMSNALWPASPRMLAVRAAIPDSTKRDERGNPRMQSAYFLYDGNGAMVDTIRAPITATEPPRLVARREGTMAMTGVPYAPGLFDALLSDGRLAAGYGDAYVIRVTRGARPLRIERDVTPVRVLPEERDEQRVRTEFQMRTVASDWRWDGPPIPDTKPLFTGLTGTADGRLWVRLSAPGERIPEAERDDPPPPTPGAPPRPPVRQWREPAWYDVYETDGTLLGRIVLPARATLLGVRGDLVWGVVRDDLDVPFLVQWRVSPGWGGT